MAVKMDPARNFKDGVIDCAKQANAQIYVDRLGDADNADAWKKAVDLGANGIQTNLPAELAAYLRAHNMATH
jgi:glycerophosphoryl diester phosphodiesterase